MRLATIKLNGAEIAGIVTPEGILPMEALNAAKGTAWKTDMMALIQAQEIPQLTAWYNAGGKEELDAIPGLVPTEQVVYAPLYRNPKRIFGIGLNYVDHAGDIGSAAPTGFPGSFFKMADTLIGPGDEIKTPALKEPRRPPPRRSWASSWAGTAVTSPRKTGRTPSWATPPFWT